MRLQTPAAHHLHAIAEINRSSGRKVFPRGHWDNKVCGKEVRRGGDEQIRPFYMPAKLVNNFSTPDAILPLTYSVYFCPTFLMLQAKCWWHGKEQKLTIPILQILLVTFGKKSFATFDSHEGFVTSGSSILTCVFKRLLSRNFPGYSALFKSRRCPEHIFLTVILDKVKFLNMWVWEGQHGPFWG